VEAPSAVEGSNVPPSSPAESPAPSPVSVLKEAAEAARAGDGTGATEISLPPEVASEAQKVSQLVAVVNGSLQPHNICFCKDTTARDLLRLRY